MRSRADSTELDSQSIKSFASSSLSVLRHSSLEPQSSNRKGYPPPRSPKVTPHRRQRSHSGFKLARKMLWLGLAALMPVYMPFLIVQFLNIMSPEQPSPSTQVKHEHNHSSVVINNYHQHVQSNEHPSLVEIERSVNNILDEKLKDSYQNRNSYMNMASEQANAQIYNLNCRPSKSLISTILSNKKSSADSECNDPQPLLQENNVKGWTYEGKTGVIYIGFKERVRIYTIGLEVFKWDLKRKIADQTRVIVTGINYYNGKDPWDGKVEETPLYNILLQDWDEKEDLVDQIRLYYNCKDRRCVDTYLGVKIELQDKSSDSSLHSLERVFVFEKF